MNNWLQQLTESYKQISLQKELENLIEEIHNEQPTLNENDIKEFLLNVKRQSRTNSKSWSGRI